MADKKDIHILLVEDDTFLANIYKTKFEMEKFNISVAGDGEAGLDCVSQPRQFPKASCLALCFLQRSFLPALQSFLPSGKP